MMIEFDLAKDELKIAEYGLSFVNFAGFDEEPSSSRMIALITEKPGIVPSDGSATRAIVSFSPGAAR